MLNPHLVVELRRAQRIFSKQGAHQLAYSCHSVRGALADHTHPCADGDSPVETEARRLVRLATGAPTNA